MCSERKRRHCTHLLSLFVWPDVFVFFACSFRNISSPFFIIKYIISCDISISRDFFTLNYDCLSFPQQHRTYPYQHELKFYSNPVPKKNVLSLNQNEFILSRFLFRIYTKLLILIYDHLRGYLFIIHVKYLTLSIDWVTYFIALWK